MRISGVTVCVGELYQDIFAKVRAKWEAGLDDLYVVRSGPFFGKEYFNQGAALNYGINQLHNPDWLLSFDCDIEPPDNWQEHLTRLDAKCLYGVRRIDAATDQLIGKSFKPYGFFQLWHSSQNRRFPEQYGHCGRRDVKFAEQWSTRNWRQLPFSVIHYGERRKYWHGVGNEHLTQALFANGAAAYYKT